jgi:hypothetical protein
MNDDTNGEISNVTQSNNEPEDKPEIRKSSRLSTFNFNPLDEFLDMEYYSYALESDSLKDIDYYLSRVTNNSRYSDNFIQEEYRNMFPKFDKTFLLDNYDNVTTSDEANNNYVKITSSHDTPLNPEKIITQFSNINYLVQNIMMEDEQEELLKVLAYFIVLSGLSELSIPVLNQHIHHFSQYKQLNIAELNHYLGGRVNSKEIRDQFIEIVNNHFNITGDNEDE